MLAHRRSLALSAAAAALFCGAPAFAQPDDPYEYAEPAPRDEVIYAPGPVIQPLPPGPADDLAVEDMGPPPLVHRAYPQPLPPAPGVAHPPMIHNAPMMAAPHHAYAPPPLPPRFDREAWLDDCRERIRGVDRKDRGGVIGGLLGGIAGGIIGNRVYDSKRLAGTLIGAGVGGFAGIAIGSAIGAVSQRRKEDECAWHLDRYMAGGYPGVAQPGYGYGYPGYGYGYGYGGYMMMPVVVAVPQRAVVRETVTEEYVDVPVRSRTIHRTKVIRHSAPAPDKRVKLIKGN